MLYIFYPSTMKNIYIESENSIFSFVLYFIVLKTNKTKYNLNIYLKLFISSILDKQYYTFRCEA